MRGNSRRQTEGEKQPLPKDGRIRGDGGQEESNDEETSVLYLDLEGLFLDLLGLEIDLDEVELDITAMPGPGRLLGNVLSPITGLLDKGPLQRLADAVSKFEMPSVSGALRDRLSLPKSVRNLLNKLPGMNFGPSDEDEAPEESEQEEERSSEGEAEESVSGSLGRMSDEELRSFATDVLEKLEERAGSNDR